MFSKSARLAKQVRVSLPVAPMASRRFLQTAPKFMGAASIRNHRLIAPRSLQLVRFQSQTVKVPDMAESITEGTLSQFLKKVGDYVEADEVVATIETDKIDVEVNTPVAGTITELLAAEEDTVEVGQELFKVEPGAKPEGGAAASKADEPAEKKTEEAASAPATEKKEEAPAASWAPAPKASEPTPAKPAATAAKETPKKAPKEETAAPKSGAFSRNEERIKMNRMRLRIAERLKESQNTNAALTTFNEVDMTSLMEMRKLYKDEFLEKTGIKFGFMGAFSRASALAAKVVPAVNAGIENGDTIVYRDYMDISIAVATPKGLVTPVVRNVESLSVLDVEQEISNLGKKARDGKLTLEDMAGGTFTISNGGVFGSLYGTPIINIPQTAVLGLHGVKQRPVVVEGGKIEARPMMYLALTYDHRMLDGREGVIFLRTIKELIEDPRKMLLM